MASSSYSRRKFAQTIGRGLLLAPVAASLTGSALAAPAQTETAHQAPPVTGKVDLNVRDYGAKGDGNTKDTIALQQALDRCYVLGGGNVTFPAGNYLTGAIQIRSNTTITLEEGAIISGSADFDDYPTMQVRWEGKWIPGHAGLIYAVDAKNIGISGPGKIAGNYALGGRPSAEKPLRHPALIELIGCSGILLENFSTDYKNMWSVHPTFCDNIHIKNLTIRSVGGNGDGIDVDSCKQVRIEGCDIATGDDCISLKSGRGMEGYTLLRTTEDVHISNCTFADSIFACIGIGSETSGGIRNVRIEKCHFKGAKTFAVYMKSQVGRGAFIENIAVDNVDAEGMEGGFLRFNLMGSGLQDQDPVPGKEGIPTVKNFSFTNIRVKDAPVLIDGVGVHPDKPLDGLVIDNITGTCKKGISLANARNAKIGKINVSGFEGPLMSVYNVHGMGLQAAAAMSEPKARPAITVEKAYKLH
ncbi:glycosyl hydrolase family 28 [Mucilaginibacter yixingensis]|uniref:Glycosyl hydrolase family 28 n=1 Tax=Mucilaginibacter yixingensis TaxID=1295612 RepID=A0A2T5J4S7_9SPHI|nr:glycosyl hydrolase family 28 protein [Mucilaginibacter yixingensis]PTQ92667.1 glycosyl hydrolase family 28 [Mucilaginibacter yixingensis]